MDTIMNKDAQNIIFCPDCGKEIEQGTIHISRLIPELHAIYVEPDNYPQVEAYPISNIRIYAIRDNQLHTDGCGGFPVSLWDGNGV